MGSRSPDGWDQIPRWAGGWVAPATLEFWIPKREEPAPPWVDSRSPDGWDLIPRWAGGWACTSRRGVLGLIPKREEPGKTGSHPVLKYRVPHGSQPRPGWAPDPLMVGIRSSDGLVVGLAPATLELWV